MLTLSEERVKKDKKKEGGNEVVHLLRERRIKGIVEKRDG